MTPTTDIPTIHRSPGRRWAVLQFPLSRFILAILFVIAPVALLQWADKSAGIVIRSPMGVVMNLVTVVATIGGSWLYVRWIECRPVSELARRGAARHVLAGMLVGAGLFCTAMLGLWLMGAWTYTGMVAGSMWIYPLVTAVTAAVVEETLMRGVLFRVLEQGLGSWIALGFSALLFGLMHAANPGATATSVIAVALEAGVLLAAAFMVSRRLWFVYGLHAAWNFTEGGIFATRVSGMDVEGRIGVQFTGSDWLTGGAFGPEASAVSVAVCLAAGVAFLVMAQRRARVVLPVWKKGSENISV
jgi:membrane protease YdiL (CAAX protease family)